MKTRAAAALVVCASILLVGLSAFCEETPFEGIAGFVEGRSRSVLREALNRQGGAWVREAFGRAIQRRGGGRESSPSPDLIVRDPQIRAEVQEELKGRLGQWLPQEAKRIIAQEILGGAEGKTACEEAEAIAAQVAGSIADRLERIADAIVAEWYDAAVQRLQGKVLGATLGLADVTDLGGSIDRAFDLQTMGDIAADQLGKIVGDAAVCGIRDRIEDALEGRLPPEAIDALERGPREFEKYVAEIERRLPGAEFQRLTDSLINRPILKLPSGAYAAILAGSAAGHFARAFKGVTVDPVELKRGVEVTRVMVWQLENKQWINLSLMQLSSLARGIASRFGAGVPFEKVVSRLRAPLDRIQKLADRVDALVKKPIEMVRGELENLTGILEDELRVLQERLMDPLREGVDRIQGHLDAAGQAIEDLLPEKFNGIPPTWAKVKEAIGIEDRKKGAPPAGSWGPSAAIAEGEEVPARNAAESDELDPVLLHNGEFIQRVTDLVIPGRGIDFRFTRIYRGRSDFLGELGQCWTHSYAERLLPWNDGAGSGLTHIDEEGLKFFFRRDGRNFISPPEISAVLTRAEDGRYELRRRDGLRTVFDADGRPIEKRDRHGNRIRFVYDERGLLSSIVDAYGRRIAFERNGDGLIVRMKDFAGRAFQYDYNDRQELVGVTTPATPDFPSGKTTAYRYAPPDAPDDPSHAITMIMDPAGRVYLRNRYDGEGRVVAQRYGDGPWMTVAYGRGEGGDVASRAWVTDALDAVRLSELDARGHLLQRWRFDGGAYQLLESHQYDEAGERVRSCLPSGFCWSLRGDEGAGDGPARRFNAFGQPVEEADNRGVLTRYEYYPASDPDGDGVAIPGVEDDAPAGYLRRIVAGDGATTFAYDPIGNITSVTDDDGRTTRYRVNALNEVVREEASGSAPIDYRFDANDDLVGVEIDAGGRRIRHAFASDGLDRPVSERWQISAGRFSETRYVYDAVGRMTEIIDPDGNRTSFVHDPEGRPRCVVRGSIPGPVVEECVERDVDGHVVAFIDGEGQRTVFVWNDSGEVIARVDPLGNRSDFTWDARGRIVDQKDFDARGTLLAEARLEYAVDGAVVRQEQRLWRDDPRRSTWVDVRPEGDAEDQTSVPPVAPMTETTIERDDLGRPIAIVRHGGKEREETRYEWTDGGRLAALTGPDGKTARFFYDGLGRLVLERFPDGTERRTSYDGRGLVVESVGRGRSVLRMTYDSAGRLALRRAASADGAAVQLQRFEHDGLGRLIFASDENDPQDPADDAVSRIAYDSLSRPIAEAFGDTWLRREFDDAGHETALASPSGVTLYTAFDRAGRPASAMIEGARIVDTARDASGEVVGGALGNFIPFWISRDALGRPVGHRYAGRGGSWQIFVDLERDETGRVVLETRDGEWLRRYHRDGLGRLVRVDEGIVAPDSHDGERMERVLRRWRYAYDAAGDVKLPPRAEENGSAPELAFDVAGNVVSDGAQRYRYDAFGRLVEVWRGDARIARYRYDAFDRRVEEEITSGTRQAIWDGGRLVASRFREAAWTNYLYGADFIGPIAAISGGKPSFLLSDRMGSAIGWADEKGELLAQCVYDPYGESSCDEIAPPFRFAGHIFDRETGLLFMRNRFYDPALGRFLTPDPLGFKAQMEAPGLPVVAPLLSYHEGQGGASRATSPNRPLASSAAYDVFPFSRIFPQTPGAFLEGEFNLYQYARNDPTTFSDPLGLASLLFDRSEERLFLLAGDGYVYQTFSASNRTVRPNADPLQVGGMGPFPNGTYSIGVPEFYSKEFRDYVIDFYELSPSDLDGFPVNGRSWRRAPKDGHYHPSFGRIRLRAGSNANDMDRVAYDRQLFLHGGRRNYRARTMGCIRVRDSDLWLLAAEFARLRDTGDPITTLIVQD